MINAAQIRAARGLLDWNRDQLAVASGVSVPALSKIETSKSNPHPETLTKVQGALEQAGCLFTDNSGVKLKSEIVQIFEGVEGYKKFCDDRYLSAVAGGGEQLFCGGRQDDFIKAVGSDYFYFHAERLATIADFKMRGLKPESDIDKNYTGYINYRVVPDEYFFGVPFYVYDNKLAIVSFIQNIRVLIIDDGVICDAYRRQFDLLWRSARSIRKPEPEENA